MANRDFQKGFLQCARLLRIRLHDPSAHGINYELDRVILDASHGIYPDADVVTIAEGPGEEQATKAPSPVRPPPRPADEAPAQPRRRRTRAQIDADNAAAAAAKAQADSATD